MQCRYISRGKKAVDVPVYPMHHPQMEYPRIELWGIGVAGRYAERYRESGVVPSKDSFRCIEVIVACRVHLDGK